MLRRVSPQLELIGVDLARTLPEPPEGTSTQGGVPMESLPFEDDSFTAVTAQFAVEYGDVTKIAPEIARVSQDGALVGLITHRGDGPILAHNVERRDAIRWAIDEEKLVEVARKSLALRYFGLHGAAPGIARAPAEGARRFGPRSAAWEIAEAIRQTVEMGARSDPAVVAATLGQIETQARNELGRIDSLERACGTFADEQAVEGLFAESGLELIETRDLSEAGAPPFAHFRLLRA